MKMLSLIVAVLIGLTMTAAPAAAQESPLTVEGAVTVNAAEAKALHDRGIEFVDVRTIDLWEAGRVPGAHYLELYGDFDEAHLLEIAQMDEEVVIYCAGPSCKRSSKACASAVEWGFQNVYYFREGFPAWQAAGYPTDPP